MTRLNSIMFIFYLSW